MFRKEKEKSDQLKYNQSLSCVLGTFAKCTHNHLTASYLPFWSFSWIKAVMVDQQTSRSDDKGILWRSHTHLVPPSECLQGQDWKSERYNIEPSDFYQSATHSCFQLSKKIDIYIYIGVCLLLKTMIGDYHPKYHFIETQYCSWVIPHIFIFPLWCIRNKRTTLWQKGLFLYLTLTHKQYGH